MSVIRTDPVRIAAVLAGVEVSDLRGHDPNPNRGP